MPRVTPPKVRSAALELVKQEGLPVDKVVDEIEVMFNVDGNPKTDPNVTGYSLSERTVRRWLNEEGWTPVDVSSYPMGAWPHPDADISKIKDAVTHFSINAAMDSVGERDSADRDIDDTIADVLEDVMLRVRPRNQGTIDFLRKRFLPAYIRAYRESPWSHRVLLDPEDRAMIDKAMNGESQEDEAPQIEVVRPEDFRQRVNEIENPESKPDTEMELEVATEMPPDEELQRMVNEEPE